MKAKAKPMILITLGVVIGGALGFAAYRFIGCQTGACPLTANPWISTLLGMLLGGLFAGNFR
ncbi:MAG: hypothetical protein PCFJNLEI_03676 [Verrucomicrobiae bacterium]|nr:hypothetical protein [Verrucomicrobiae bacterium]